MFGTSGIRGTVGETVTAELALSLGRAVGSAMHPESVVVGRDPRTTGPLLLDALSAGLRETGVDVIDIGVEATPTIARSIGWQGADFGIAVTASHNPPTDNGFKFWNPDGSAFDSAQRDMITDCVNADAFDLTDWTTVGTQSTWNGAREMHASAIEDAVDLSASPNVIVDIGNGAGRVTADILAGLGCPVQTLNAQQDGCFPGRASEPDANSLQPLAEFVAATNADLGVAHDGDADRMMAVDNTGSFITGDELLALFALEAADRNQKIAAPVNTSLLVDDALAEIDVEVTRTKVGDGYVAAETSNPDVVFGGEPSGAWIWPTETRCPDGPLAAVKLVELVATHGSLAEQVASLPTYPLRRESIDVEAKATVFQQVKESIMERYEDVQTRDGVRVQTDDGWFLIRPSGTQPLIRVTAEARSGTDCDELLGTAVAVVTTIASQ